ncbi:rhomboid family intramembrane serine protease [Marinoscillum furvescens]|uniref:Membrane associated rhomboid family serine protease n=1 Tax=Marinoscillum furvescens DSM 4134 TaxID=1122208 RepID=A0A3D9L5Z0_MARFU|nr:rhomboid family intramembrane serine protease [Marinoscillum furvescens]REE01590.1 membrane associated rhomboid family serine protease [Marinoscillum furvescens DSM 4134]
MISLTTLIIIVTVAISLLAFSNAEVFQKSLMNPFMVFKKNQYWRFVTSGFIHGSYIHLGFNMFTFYFFGRVVEQVFMQLYGGMGAVLFILFYLSAIVISDLPVAWKKKDQLNYNSLGASGAVSAMVFASILYFPLNDICLYGILCLPGFILGTIYIVYSYYQGRNISDNINHEAHLYGAIYGAVFAIAMYPASAKGFIDQVSTYSIF